MCWPRRIGVGPLFLIIGSKNALESFRFLWFLDSTTSISKCEIVCKPGCKQMIPNNTRATKELDVWRCWFISVLSVETVFTETLSAKTQRTIQATTSLECF